MKYRFDLTTEQIGRCFVLGGTSDQLFFKMNDELEEWVRTESIGHFVGWDWSINDHMTMTMVVSFESKDHAAQFKLKFL